MTRPKIIDSFMYNNETAMLECRLTEMYDAVDWVVIVESDVDHQNHPKPFHYLENQERFSQWADKIIPIQATGLPATNHNVNPWAREHAQREWTRFGLGEVPGLTLDDVVLHGDVDEICRPLYVRNVRPKHGEFVSFDQRLHCFAVDWLHPDPWRGTVAATVGSIVDLGDDPFAKMRDGRNRYKPLMEAGWHLSWMGGRDAAMAKLGSFCHPEIADRTLVGLQQDRFNREGFHVDGRRMIPVDVTDDWPKYIYERKCPDNWFRPR